MKFSIRKDDARKVSTVEFSWTNGEMQDLSFSPIELAVLNQHVNSAVQAALVINMIAQAQERADKEAEVRRGALN